MDVDRPLYQSLFIGLMVLLLAAYRVLVVLRSQPEGSRPHTRISLEETVPTPEHLAARAFLRVVITPVLTEGRNEEIRYGRLVTYLGRRIGLEPLFLRLQPYSEEARLLRHQRCDLALVCSGPFARGEREGSMEALAVPLIGGKTSYNSLVIVPRSSTATTLRDLRSSRFALADMNCITAWIYPASCLRQMGLDADHFFGTILIAGGHDRAVRAVLSGAADAAGVDSLVYDDMALHDPSVRAGTRIILRSKDLGCPVFAVNPRADSKLKERLRAALLSMHEDAAGRQALAAANVDRFVEPGPAHFDGVRELLRAWESRP